MQVLRFYGYFKEAVVESRLENHKIHDILIYYFLEDKSIMMIEPRQSNSGQPQGAFLKRQMVLRGDGLTPFMPQDFRVGLDIGIHGRAIRIYDADPYTREFFIVSTFHLVFVTVALMTLFFGRNWLGAGRGQDLNLSGSYKVTRYLISFVETGRAPARSPASSLGPLAPSAAAGAQSKGQHAA